MNVKIIVDDVGLSKSINNSVKILAEKRCISGLAISVCGKHHHDLKAFLGNLPNLEFGIHLVLSDESKKLRTAFDQKYFKKRRDLFLECTLNPLKMYYFIKREVSAQIEKYNQLGLPLNFINTHQHTHLHPLINYICKEKAKEYKIPLRNLRKLKKNYLQNFTFKAKIKNKLTDIFCAINKCDERQKIISVFDFPNMNSFQAYDEILKISKNNSIDLEVMAHTSTQPDDIKYLWSSNLDFSNKRVDEFHWLLSNGVKLIN